MALQDRLESLKDKHATLEARLHEEECRPHPDHDITSLLKRNKLRVKDEMARIEAA